MEIGDALKQRRIELDLTQAEVAQRAGVSEATISRWESGDIANMKRDKIVSLASALDISPGVIMGWDQELPGVPYNPTHKIPILGYISAGAPLYAEQHIEGYTFTDLNGGDEYYALRVKGDSMNAVRIYDGDLLVIRRQDTVENGEIAVVLVDGENATVKRFYCTGTTITLVPQSTNPVHQIQVYDARQEAVRVLGKVVRNLIEF
jgi:repressor LexA